MPRKALRGRRASVASSDTTDCWPKVLLVRLRLSRRPRLPRPLRQVARPLRGDDPPGPAIVSNGYLLRGSGGNHFPQPPEAKTWVCQGSVVIRHACYDSTDVTYHQSEATPGRRGFAFLRTYAILMRQTTAFGGGLMRFPAGREQFHFEIALAAVKNSRPPRRRKRNLLALLSAEVGVFNL